jgi:hypothetical protein
MAAGAIPPPLFFERRRAAGISAPKMAFSYRTPEQHTSVDHAIERPARTSPTTRDRLPPKDI